MKRTMVAALLVLLMLIVFACAKNSTPTTPEPQPTNTPTATMPANTSTVTNTATSTEIQTNTETPTATITLTHTITMTPTLTSTATYVPTVVITPADICRVFGNINPTVYWQTTGRTTFGKFSLASQQTATKIYFNGGIDAQVKTFKAGIYSDNSNFPGVRLTASIPDCYTNGRGWYIFDIDDIVLPAGTYWLAIASADDGSASTYGSETTGGTGGINAIHGVILPDDCSAYTVFSESYAGNHLSSFVSCD